MTKIAKHIRLLAVMTIAVAVIISTPTSMEGQVGQLEASSLRSGDWVRLSFQCSQTGEIGYDCPDNREGTVAAIEDGYLVLTSYSDSVPMWFELARIRQLQVRRVGGSRAGDKTITPAQMIFTPLVGAASGVLLGAAGYSTSSWDGILIGISGGLILGSSITTYLLGQKNLPGRGSFFLTTLGATVGTGAAAVIRYMYRADIMTVVLVTAGAAAGALTGYRFSLGSDPGSFWERIPLDRIRIEGGPGPNGGFGFGAGVTFELES